MRTLWHQLLWVLGEISFMGFFVFLLLTLIMLLFDPYLNYFFSQQVSILSFLAVTAIFFMLMLYQLHQHRTHSL